MDPAPIAIGGQLHLYFTILGPGPAKIARGLLDSTGTVLTYEGVVFSSPTLPLVDPDVVRDSSGLFWMFAFSGPSSWALTSTSGLAFTPVAELTSLANRGLTRPLDQGTAWWMYTFDQQSQPVNAVRLYSSSDLVNWSQLAGPLFWAPAGRTLTDPQVVLEGATYRMVFKTD